MAFTYQLCSEGYQIMNPKTSNIISGEVRVAALGAYCICSNKTLGNIISIQRQEMLPFSEVLEFHTLCKEGCGSCIDKLKELMKEEDLFVE